MVDDLVVAAELGILVLQRVEAVGALRDDLLHAEAVEGLDVLGGEHLEDVLVARSPGRAAAAELPGSQDREVDPGAAEELGDRPAGALVAIVEAAGAADPVEVLVVERSGAVDDGDALEVLRPVGALALVHA